MVNKDCSFVEHQEAYPCTLPEPLSVLALGNISFNGNPAPRSSRIKKTDQFITVDDSLCFTAIACSDAELGITKRWVKVPGFLPQLTSTERKHLPLIYQINDFYAAKESSSLLHALYDSDGQEYFPITLLPSPKQSQLTFQSAAALSEKLSELEEMISNDCYHQAQEELAELLKIYPDHPRISFALGSCYYTQQKYQEAKESFHQATLYGHPDAIEAEWKCCSKTAKTLRDQYPETFFQIQNGDALCALTVLRNIKTQHPLHANAALAYCLRHANLPFEGIEACQTSLEHDACQADLYGHLWSYYTSLNADSSAKETSALHLQHYPLNPQAYIDALDSALMLGESGKARFFALAYATHAANLTLAWKNLFKYYDAVRQWDQMSLYYQNTLQLMPAPTPQTLTEYGECLIETGEFTKASNVLERALSLAPESSDTVLAYGRALAKSGDLNGAIRFMTSVMQDRNRTDSCDRWYLMLSFLSELMRNNGYLEEAFRLWREDQEIGEQLLKTAGPRPLVEYTYCLAEMGKDDESVRLFKLLEEQASDQFIVQELGANLRNIGMPV